MKRFSQFVAESVPLECHDVLNPKLWADEDHLKPDVRTKLFGFARAWQAFAKIPDALVHDIVMVGGNASYLYTPYSDIDVHLVVDKDGLGPRAMVDDYLKSKKHLWTALHNVHVEGYGLEPYAQGLDEMPKSSGIYSVRNDMWVVKPVKDCDASFANDPNLDSKVEYYSSLINHLMDSRASLEQFNKLKVKLSSMRKAGLAKGGERSLENQTFKALRNLGLLDKMTLYMRQLQDQELSL